jgi:hypothetical protein
MTLTAKPPELAYIPRRAWSAGSAVQLDLVLACGVGGGCSYPRSAWRGNSGIPILRWSSSRDTTLSGEEAK